MYEGASSLLTMAADVQQRLQELREIELDIAGMRPNQAPSLNSCAADIHALEKGEVAAEDLAEHLRAVRGLVGEGHRVLQARPLPDRARAYCAQSARSIVDELELVKTHKDLRERLSQEKHELQRYETACLPTLICIRMEAMIPAALHAAKAKGALNARDSLLFGAKDQHSKIQCVFTAGADSGTD